MTSQADWRSLELHSLQVRVYWRLSPSSAMWQEKVFDCWQRPAVLWRWGSMWVTCSVTVQRHTGGSLAEQRQKTTHQSREQRPELPEGNGSCLHRQKMVLICSRLRSPTIHFPARQARTCRRSCEGHPPGQHGAVHMMTESTKMHKILCFQGGADSHQ